MVPPQIEEQADAWNTASKKATRVEVDRLIASVNTEALCSRASALRNGVPCTVPVLTSKPGGLRTLMGGMNYHIPITFANGEEWMCRIRRSNASSPPQELQDRILLSEVATLRFLSSTKVPVPKVHGFALRTAENNTVGVSYILMDKLIGHALDLEPASREQKIRFLNQFADVFAELSLHPFPAIGCLVANSGALEPISIGPLVAERTASFEERKLALLGPFNTATEYRTQVLRRYLALIRDRELYSEQARDAYLVHRFLLDDLPSVAKADLAGSNRFFLKHMDDKGDHILVDDDFNIVGIIDWEWAQTVPMSEAFAAPLFMLDVAKYYGGDNTLSETENMFVALLEKKGYTQLASSVNGGRVQHRLAHCIGGDIEDPEFYNLFTGFLQLTHGTPVGKYAWDEWHMQVMTQYSGDPWVQTILEKEVVAPTSGSPSIVTDLSTL